MSKKADKRWRNLLYCLLHSGVKYDIIMIGILGSKNRYQKYDVGREDI